MKNIFIGLVIIAVLAIIGWMIYRKVDTTDTTYNLSLNPSANATTTSAGNNTTTVAAAGAKPKSTSTTFKSIFTQDGNSLCEYEQVTPLSQSSDVIYIADGKMRGEFRTKDANKTTVTLMIYTGGYLYTWSEGGTVAKRTQISTIADLPQAIPNDLTSGAVLGGSAFNVSWDCHAWNKDVNLLKVPSYLTY